MDHQQGHDRGHDEGGFGLEKCRRRGRRCTVRLFKLLQRMPPSTGKPLEVLYPDDLDGFYFQVATDATFTTEHPLEIALPDLDDRSTLRCYMQRKWYH